VKVYEIHDNTEITDSLAFHWRPDPEPDLSQIGVRTVFTELSELCTGEQSADVNECRFQWRVTEVSPSGE